MWLVNLTDEEHYDAQLLLGAQERSVLNLQVVYLAAFCGWVFW